MNPRSDGGGGVASCGNAVVAVLGDRHRSSERNDDHASTIEWSECPPSGWPEADGATPPSSTFLRPSWFAAWSSAYGSAGAWQGGVRYLSVRSEDGLLAVLPMALQIVAGVRFVSLAGLYTPFRGVPLLRQPSTALPRLIATLGELPGIAGVRLGPLSEDDDGAIALVAALRGSGWRILETTITTEFTLDLPATVAGYRSQLTSKKLRRLRYYWNRMCKAGETVLSHFNDLETGEWERVLLDLGAIEAASWVGERGTPRFDGARNLYFWTRLADDAWLRRAMHAWVIYHEGTPVSFCFALDAGDTRYVIANSYDSRVARYSTGSKIYCEIIEDAIRRGLRTVNIGIGDSGYKTSWGATGKRRQVDLIAFPPAVRGRLAHLAARAKLWLDVRVAGRRVR